MRVVIRFSAAEERKALPILLRHSPGTILPGRTYVRSRRFEMEYNRAGGHDHESVGISQSQVNADATLSVPPEVARQVAPEQPVRVVLLIGEDSDAPGWERLAAEEFLQRYAPSDAIYDMQ